MPDSPRAPRPEPPAAEASSEESARYIVALAQFEYEHTQPGSIAGQQAVRILRDASADLRALLQDSVPRATLTEEQVFRIVIDAVERLPAMLAEELHDALSDRLNINRATRGP